MTSHKMLSAVPICGKRAANNGHTAVQIHSQIIHSPLGANLHHGRATGKASVRQKSRNNRTTDKQGTVIGTTALMIASLGQVESFRHRLDMSVREIIATEALY